MYLFFRPVRGLSGGLCGLASLYQALENTILTVSQLTQFTYADMRAAIAEEMGTNTSSTSTLTDSALLDQYYACKIMTMTNFLIGKMFPKTKLCILIQVTGT